MQVESVRNRLIDRVNKNTVGGTIKIGMLGVYDCSKIHFDVPPLKNIFGRQTEVKAIKNLWKCSQEKRTLRFAVLTGIGGIGKTATVKSFVHNYAMDSIDFNCIWIDASTSESILNSFRRLATELQISKENLSGEEKPLAQLVENIYKNVLESKSILILDNLNSYDEPILQILVSVSSKRGPNKWRPFVIITSRNGSIKEYFGSRGEQIHLDVLPLEDAIQLVNNSLGIQKEDFENISLSKRLCKRLACFPLALLQALSFMMIQSGSDDLENKFQNIFHILDTDIKKVLESPLTKDGIVGYKTTNLVYQSTIKKIKEFENVGMVAVEVLKVVAFLPPENISTSLLKDILTGLPHAMKNVGGLFKTACRLLSDYSICKLNEELGYISINSLLQEVIKDYLLSDEATTIDALDGILYSLQRIKEDKFLADETIPLKSIYRHATPYTTLVAKYSNFLQICELTEDMLDN